MAKPERPKRFNPLQEATITPEAFDIRQEINIDNLESELQVYLEDQLANSKPLQDLALEMPAFFLQRVSQYLQDRYPSLLTPDTHFHDIQCKREARGQYTIIMPLGTDSEIRTQAHLTFKFEYSFQKTGQKPRISDFGIWVTVDSKLLHFTNPKAQKVIAPFLGRRNLRLPQ